ncbi:MAG: ATP-grasp domain-containing protein [Patescibacteria group bacterium]|nr:ATP-grasp domain-containing protein [Patescibacteria group bacterium]MDD4304121.1 ATP-grasp domain-containing protein [Patescibacteria group bacterium]MDD4694998.1 ATP-grasp domain-containing protein [Patescibacteria group bacterium]
MKKNNEHNNTEKNIIEGKTILLVNTGSSRKRFILQRIKKLGVKIIALNKEKNWAQPYVDEWICANTNIHSEAIKAVEKFIKKNTKIKIDGVITFWEDDVLLTSKLAEKFDFTGIPYKSANIARNKFLFREFCEKNKIPHIKHMILSSEKDIDKAIEILSFPLVIKPVYGSSSAYVIKVENKEELLQSFKYIKESMSKSVESSLNDGLDVMVEEYIDGDEVDIDILIQNGRLKFYSVSDNDKTNEPFFIETGRSTPSNLPMSSQDDLINMAYECLEKIGIQNGCLHFEAKETKNGPIPIEINLRMGGDEMYSSVKVAWHVDLIESALKIAMGIYLPEAKKLDSPYKYIVSKDFISDESGILSRLNIDEKLKENKYVNEIQFFKEIGDSIFMPPEGYDYLGWITVVGDNYLDAQDNLEEATKLVNFEVARFHPMSSIGKTSRKNSFSFSALNHSSIIIDKTKIEKIRKMSIANQKNLHIGIACNIYDDKNSLIENELASVGKNIEKALKERGYKVTFFDFNNITKVFNDLKTSDVDMVFNVCERINDSSLLEPHATSILDVLQIPYTGSNPFTLGLCIDKIRVKKLLTYHKIPTPRWDYLYSLDDEIRDDLKYPLIVKPANTDNSIGITNDSVVTNKEQLKKQLHKVMIEIGRPALIEEYIEGDEYDVSIIGSNEDDLRVLPLSRSIFNNMPEGYWHIYPFEAKYTDDKNYKKIIIQRPPKNLNKKLETLISEIALDTYNILDCHDYGRVEIRVDKNHNPYVLELNPNPSINISDCVPSVAKLIGLNYGDFIEEIIRLSIKRYKDNPPYFHLQPNII